MFAMPTLLCPLDERLDDTLDDARENIDRVRPIGEVLACLLSQYQIAAEPTPGDSRPWIEARLSVEMASSALALLAE
jgi:hypothetical protein